MTAWTLCCPNCHHRQALHLTNEDTAMSLGQQIAPNVVEMKEHDETNVFESAQIAWSLFEQANGIIQDLGAEYDRVVGQLEALSGSERSHGPFVASPSRTLFHRPQCKWAEYFLHKRTVSVFETHEDAVAAGKRPCRTCCA